MRMAPVGTLPAGRAGLVAVAAAARWYVIGGNDAAGQYDATVISARSDAGRPQIGVAAVAQAAHCWRKAGVSQACATMAASVRRNSSRVLSRSCARQANLA